MNRLIIIGNGFDLAHGLDTSFKDFFYFYLRKVWRKLPSGEYNDKLMTIESCGEYFREKDIQFSDDTALEIFSNILKENFYNNTEPRLFIRSNLFKSIFTNAIDSNWADIEVEYFNELTHIIEVANKKKDKSGVRYQIEIEKTKAIKKLHEELDELQGFLIEYLTSRQDWFNNIGKVNDEFLDTFEESIYFGEGQKNNIELKSKLFLNFNYTDTLQKYVSKREIIYIHGTLTNSPIFGFGDDTSERYKVLENEYISAALEKIKSFSYLKSNNYKKLITFIELEPYQVHIYGHSCGVSDRTLLKKIFENKHCKHIKIFYHNESDFTSKTYEIPRHFDDKNEFLEKVTPFDSLRMMTQSKLN